MWLFSSLPSNAWPGMTVLTFHWIEFTRLFALTMPYDCLIYPYAELMCCVLNVLYITFSELLSRSGERWPKSLTINQIQLQSWHLLKKIEPSISTCVAYKPIIMKWIGTGFHLWHGLSNRVRLDRLYCSIRLAVLCNHVSVLLLLGLSKSIIIT